MAVSRYSKKPLLDVLGEVTGNDKCHDLSRIFTSLLTMKAVDALKTIRYQLKFADYLKSCKVGTARLDTLEFLAQEDASLADFVAHMERLQKIIRDGRKEPASFVLSTIHSAKGLEYDHVILADVYDGEFPVDPYQTETPLVGETDLEEERRLFYVGMTRARKRLVLFELLDRLRILRILCLKREIRARRNPSRKQALRPRRRSPGRKHRNGKKRRAARAGTTIGPNGMMLSGMKGTITPHSGRYALPLHNRLQKESVVSPAQVYIKLLPTLTKRSSSVSETK